MERENKLLIEKLEYEKNLNDELRKEVMEIGEFYEEDNLKSK